MTKKEIIAELVGRSNLTTSQAIHAVDGVIDIIADALQHGEPVFLRDFGTLKPVRRASKPARNISHGTQIMLPPTTQVKFIAYNNLKKRINGLD